MVGDGGRAINQEAQRVVIKAVDMPSGSLDGEPGGRQTRSPGREPWVPKEINVIGPAKGAVFRPWQGGIGCRIPSQPRACGLGYGSAALRARGMTFRGFRVFSVPSSWRAPARRPERSQRHRRPRRRLALPCGRLYIFGGHASRLSASIAEASLSQRLLEEIPDVQRFRPGTEIALIQVVLLHGQDGQDVPPLLVGDLVPLAEPVELRQEGVLGAGDPDVVSLALSGLPAGEAGMVEGSE